MLADEHPKTMTDEEYLQSEVLSHVKREYIDGRVYAMAGAGPNHNRISVNISSEFQRHLKGMPCETYMADMKVRSGNDYFYPDVMVDCASLERIGQFTTSPILIIEVLSKSTRKNDTTIKLMRYINMESLQEYVLIEQDSVCVHVLRKTNNWLSEYFYLGDTVTFESIGLSLAVEEIYDRVDNDDMREFRQQKQNLPD